MLKSCHQITILLTDKERSKHNVWSLRSKLVLCDVKFNSRYFFVLKQGNEQKEIKIVKTRTVSAYAAGWRVL